MSEISKSQKKTNTVKLNWYEVSKLVKLVET